MRQFLTAIAALSLTTAAISAPIHACAEEPAAATKTTRVLDKAAAKRLRGATGVTLQWISWDWRGRVAVTQKGGVYRIKGGQDAANAPKGTADLGRGKVAIDGVVTEIGRDYFRFDGTIVITDTPDAGRVCTRTGPMTFKVTKNRKYWRLQEMEKCDGLTDYVDIYF